MTTANIQIHVFRVVRFPAALFCLTLCICSNLPEEYSVRHHSQFFWSSPPDTFSHGIDTTGISLKDRTFVPTLSVYDDYNSISSSYCQYFEKLTCAEVSDADFTPGTFFSLAVGDTFSVRIRAFRPIVESGIHYSNSADVRLISKENEIPDPDSVWEYISRFSFQAIRRSKGYIHFHSLNDDSPRNTVCYCTETPDRDSVIIDSVTWQFLVNVNTGDTIVNMISVQGWTNALKLNVAVRSYDDYYSLYYYYGGSTFRNEFNPDGTFVVDKQIRLRLEEYLQSTDPFKLITRGVTGLDRTEYIFK